MFMNNNTPLVSSAIPGEARLGFIWVQGRLLLGVSGDPHLLWHGRRINTYIYSLCTGKMNLQMSMGLLVVGSCSPEALGGDGDASSQDFVLLICCFFPPQLLPEKEMDYSECPQMHREWGCPPRSTRFGAACGEPCTEPQGCILPSFMLLHERNPRSWRAALPALAWGVCLSQAWVSRVV